MSKQFECQRFIFKIHSSRLRQAKWKLTLPVGEARKNEEVISLASSQVLRWLDELNGITDADSKAKEIKSEIRRLKKDPASIKARRAIRQLYDTLDAIQFKPDYLCLIIDKEKDYYRACKGFSINGINYVRLLGTNGGVKNSTIVFVSERHANEIKRRIDNGRNMNKPMVPAKLEAYKALACSASIPVSLPNGILVVKDCETVFRDDTIYIDDECDGEPLMELRKNVEIKLDASDGFGLACPALAERWSEELQLGYTAAGFNTRFSFEKGMVYTFDFHAFARDVAENYIVKDIWGNEVDVRDVELILTESMLKLWDSYDSCEDYLNNCEDNGYTFGITKTCAEKLESERHLNYQFIQSYDLDDDDIEELIAPTINEFKEVLGGDWRKTLLFLCGSNLNINSVLSRRDDFVKAMMITPEIFNDNFVKAQVKELIRRKIDDAKVGVIKVHGNYSIASGDPYALCQSIFGLEITGLLKAGEIYNKYWSDIGTEKLVCFRAPMTCHNNIRAVKPVNSIATSYWYQYMNACTIFNAWDTSMAALNGMDFDGDLVMLTDNDVLVRKHKVLPTIMCVQRKAEKKIVTEEDAIIANTNSFGNDIGKITNRITSMFEIKSKYNPDSLEYKILEYRIKCGQLLQQNAIDKAKGIIAKPMPRAWHDRHSVNMISDIEEARLQRSIVADKKPYFMKYIYPDLSLQYSKYIQNTTKSALREFGKTVEELKEIPYKDLTDEQRNFLYYYEVGMPVGLGDCVMNKICHRFEEEFSTINSSKPKESKFDYSILKSDTAYPFNQYRSVREIYNEFIIRSKYIASLHYEGKVEADEAFSAAKYVRYSFKRDCDFVCSDPSALCNIIVDICYSKSSSKKFAWDISGSEIIKNLLNKNNGRISFPVPDDNGDIYYCGNRFSMHTEELYI